VVSGWTLRIITVNIPAKINSFVRPSLLAILSLSHSVLYSPFKWLACCIALLTKITACIFSHMTQIRSVARELCDARVLSTKVGAQCINTWDGRRAVAWRQTNRRIRERGTRFLTDSTLIFGNRNTPNNYNTRVVCVPKSSSIHSPVSIKHGLWQTDKQTDRRWTIPDTVLCICVAR